ncbi:MAG: cob(I)yrinic acid a,c-diamide adenosyltransferase [Myxococcota bacterium]
MSFIINRVYTKVGDRGTSRLAGGQEVDKDSARLEAYGTIDELNACLGVLVETMGGPSDEGLSRALVRIQNELFDLGGELAVLPEDRHQKQQLIQEADVLRLETEMDQANGSLPALRSFILPGGGPISAALHVARTVCRRAERRLVTLHHTEPQRAEALRYLNRLSDWLFVMGRKAAADAGRDELLWRPGER